VTVLVVARVHRIVIVVTDLVVVAAIVVGQQERSRL
jgi:hypothetical protein